jgi:ribosomal protein S18 acetylase RimI-like enzyme
MYREALSQDFKAFNALMNQVQKIHHNGIPEFYKPSMEEFPYEDYLKEIKLGNINVLEIENSIIGFSYHNIIEIKDNPAIYDQSIMYIIDVCVDENSRHKGYGKEIFNGLRNIAKKNTCRSINLDVYNFNKEAISFYKKLNFSEEKVNMSIRI